MLLITPYSKTCHRITDWLRWAGTFGSLWSHPAPAGPRPGRFGRSPRRPHGLSHNLCQGSATCTAWTGFLMSWWNLLGSSRCHSLLPWHWAALKAAWLHLAESSQTGGEGCSPADTFSKSFLKKLFFQYLKDELTVLQGLVFSVISVGTIQIFLDRSENFRLTEWSVNTQTKVKLLCTDICFQLCKET